MRRLINSIIKEGRKKNRKGSTVFCFKLIRKTYIEFGSDGREEAKWWISAFNVLKDFRACFLPLHLIELFGWDAVIAFQDNIATSYSVSRHYQLESFYGRHRACKKKNKNCQAILPARKSLCCFFLLMFCYKMRFLSSSQTRFKTLWSEFCV